MLLLGMGGRPRRSPLGDDHAGNHRDPGDAAVFVDNNYTMIVVFFALQGCFGAGGIYGQNASYMTERSHRGAGDSERLLLTIRARSSAA